MDQMDGEVQELMDAFGYAPVSYTPPASSSLGAPAVMLGEGQTTADQALAQLANTYKDLQLQAGRILTLFGSNAPCEVINRHYAAVEAYMNAARDVFFQLTSQGFTVVQKLYNLQGESIGEQKGPAPVRPAYFEPCNTAGQFGRTVINLGTFRTADSDLGVLPVIAIIVIALIVGATVVAVTHTIVVNNPILPIKQVEAQAAWMDSYLGCVERSMKADPKLTHATADATCRGLTAPPKPPEPVDLTKMLIIVGIVGISAIAVYAAWNHYQQRARFAPPPPPPLLPPHPAVSGHLAGLDPAVVAGLDRQAYLMGYCPCR